MNVTPDGVRYITSANQRVARPFHYRWLMPKLCGNYARRWQNATYASLGACQAAIYIYVGGGWRGLAAALLMLGLAGVVKFNLAHPVLVDAPGMACALLAADAFKYHYWPLGIALAIVGGCVRETSPVFAALYAWNPLALIGLVPVAARHVQREGPDVLDTPNRWILDHPILASRQFHLGQRHNDALEAHRPPAALYVLPWGVCLVALAHPSLQLAATVAIAYAMVAVATDTVRLYQWSWPVVLLATVYAVPVRWLPVLVVLQLVNPFASEGG